MRKTAAACSGVCHSRAISRQGCTIHTLSKIDANCLMHLHYVFKGNLDVFGKSMTLGAMSKGKRSERVAESQRALIFAAERLVAERGFAGVTVREINAMAGTRNASAISYHFGSLRELFAAVFKLRFVEINELRMAQIAAMDEHDLRSHIDAIVYPLTSQLRPRGEGNCYIRFSNRVFLEPVFFDLKISPMLFSGWTTIETGIRRLLHDIPGPVLDFRLNMFTWHVFSDLAIIEARLEQGHYNHDSIGFLFEAITDSAVAMLKSEVSEKTRALLP